MYLWVPIWDKHVISILFTMSCGQACSQIMLDIDCELARAMGFTDQYVRVIVQASGRSQLSTAAFH